MSDVEHAGRQAGLGERLGDVQAGERRLVRELEHDRVAVDERRRELPDRDREREVPRRDQRRRRRAAGGASRPARPSPPARSARRPGGTPRPRRSGGSAPRAPASPRASRSGLPISVVMSCAICSTRASSTSAAAFRYAARRAIGSAAHAGERAPRRPRRRRRRRPRSTTGTRRSTRDGRIGFVFVYVSPEDAGTHAPPT